MYIHSARPGKRRGIFLITVLFFALLIAVYAEGALLLAPASLTRAAADTGVAAATRAAKSGLDYLRVRISNDPQWNASVAQTFSAPGLYVREGEGQVEGWLMQDQRWSRFRVRFNYQDGAASAALNSDGMNDPSSPWRDFPYLSCNNLVGGAARTCPVAGTATSYVSSGPWSNTQLTVPAASLFVSVEGSSGQAYLSGGNPAGFYAAPHKRTVQTVLKLGDNQPITSAAVMSAGDLDVSTYGSPLQLSSVGPETARLRSKGSVRVGDISSTNAELRNGSTGTTTTGARTGTVTNSTDIGTDGFYKIPLSKVREATGGLSLAAGVYVVNDAGQVFYHDMNYADYVATPPATAGTAVSLPPGMSLVANPGPGPKYHLKVTADLSISATGTATDFALIPDGGAPQSAAYGGVPSTTPSPANPGGASSFVSFLGAPPLDDVDDSDGVPGIGAAIPLNGSQLSEWNNTVSSLPQPGGFTTPDGVQWKRFTLPDGGWIGIPDQTGKPIRLGGNRPPGGPISQDVALANFLNTISGTQMGKLHQVYPTYTPTGTPSPSASPSASPTAAARLQPKDLELQLQGGTAGLTVQNKHGSITIGAQIQGNGASIVSYKDVSLIGTSTDLSSDPGTSLGLNLYARGKITIDAFKLDSAGNSTFHGINMRGVMYAWSDVNVLAGNSTISAPFNLTGVLIAYGGDPTGSPSPGGAHTRIAAQAANLVYDASYVASLLNSGPFVLRSVSWHEF